MSSSPPITELAMTVQFPALSASTVLDYADLYELFRDRFPLLQQTPRLGAIEISPEDPTRPPSAGIQFTEVEVDALLPRLWMISSDSKRVVQFQTDRFGFNWRRTEGLSEDTAYPGYLALKEEFASLYREFSNWARRRFGDAPRPTAGDIFYVNHLPLQTDSGKKRISEAFKFFSPQSKSKIGGFQTSWMEQIEGNTPGYASLQAMAGTLPDGTPVAVLHLAGRVLLDNAGPEPEIWFDIAHQKTLEMFEAAIILDSSKDQK